MPTISRNYKSGGIESSEVDLNLYPRNTNGVVTPSAGLLNAPADLDPPLTISTNGTEDNYEQKAVDISGDTACRSYTTAFGWSPWLVQGTAAYSDVQTSPTDTTPDRVLLTDALGDNSGPIFTIGSLNTVNFECENMGQTCFPFHGRDSTRGRAWLPISSFRTPASITVTGTFEAVAIDGTVVGTGLDSTDIVISSLNSFKYAVLSINNLAGVNANDIYELRAESGGSSIEVNF